MEKLRCAVIGVGYLGKFHAEKYTLLDQTKLVAVVDADETRSSQIAAQLRCDAYADYRKLLGKVDAVSIVTPTTSHFDVAKFFLENGVSCLIEKPITTTVDEAEALIRVAGLTGAMIQVGHLERFNGAIMAVKPSVKKPKFIESHRIAPFNLRAKDVNVVLDLMIHDIDLIRYLTESEITHVVASGAPVLTQEIDIANARIEFANGAVANVTASRAGSKQERKMRIFQEDAYFSVDLQEKSYSVYKKGIGEMFPGIPAVEKQSFHFPDCDAIKLEIQAFAEAILNKTQPAVTAEDGKMALQIAQQITKLVAG